MDGGYSLIYDPAAIYKRFPTASPTNQVNLRVIAQVEDYSSDGVYITAMYSLNTNSQPVLISLDKVTSIPSETAEYGSILDVYGVYDGFVFSPHTVRVLDPSSFADSSVFDVIRQQSEEIDPLDRS